MSTKSQRLRLKERREFIERVEANRTSAYDKQVEEHNKNADLSEENVEAKNEPKPKKKVTTTKKKASQKAK